MSRDAGTGPDPLVRFGRPTPWRGMVVSLVLGIGATLVGTVFGLLSAHPEHTPLMLMFLLIPAIVIPLLIGLNQYAEFDQRSGLIRINGGEAQPLSSIVLARTMIFRGVSTLDLGTGPGRRERFIVANGPFGSPRVERDWVRHLLPYTGLPRRGTMPPDAFGTRHLRSATLEDATVFAHEWLK
ncbi:hypothetical protein [Agreia sp. Leaf244]|uniref:hypothetical protein n=1 Tax=Agreia sp. Leaf244 TaxID=1736305 RepID=UPI0012F70B55|nr:hypothetical protein [Agreia sp. Leaf244]